MKKSEYKTRYETILTLGLTEVDEKRLLVFLLQEIAAALEKPLHQYSMEDYTEIQNLYEEIVNGIESGGAEHIEEMDVE